MTRFLSTRELLAIAKRMLGDQFAVRDVGLLESAAARPRTALFGEDAYETLPEKAAALLQSIVMNHPLVDGNKRLGFVAAAVFLEINGLPLGEPDKIEEPAYRLVVDVASGESSDVLDIAKRLIGLLAIE